MWFIYLLLFFVMAFGIFVVFMSKRYGNPYKLYMVFGKKGSGKTTYMCKLALQYHKKGWKVYSNIDLPYAYVFNVNFIGNYVAEPNSCLLIDEVGMIWDNRDYKKFRPEVRDYFKLQRHYRHVVYLFSQTFDIDLKLRNLTDGMFLVTSPVPGISILRRIKRTVTLLQPTADVEGRIADSLEFVPLYMNLFGAKAFQLTFIPKYAKYFSSFDAPKLPSLTAVSHLSSIFLSAEKDKKSSSILKSILSKLRFK